MAPFPRKSLLKNDMPCEYQYLLCHHNWYWNEICENLKFDESMAAGKSKVCDNTAWCYVLLYTFIQRPASPYLHSYVSDWFQHLEDREQKGSKPRVVPFTCYTLFNWLLVFLWPFCSTTLGATRVGIRFLALVLGCCAILACFSGRKWFDNRVIGLWELRCVVEGWCLRVSPCDGFFCACISHKWVLFQNSG